MKVYKFVLPSHNYYVSAVVDGKAEVKYFPGRWAKAPFWLRRRGYHLTAFKDLKSAREWAVTECGAPVLNLHAELWEAEAKGVIDKLPPVCLLWKLSQGIIKQGGNFGCWPKGTIMVKRLRLIKPIETVYDLVEKRRSDATRQLDTSN